MTRKENLLRTIRRQQPEWIPNGMEGLITVLPPVVERPAEAGCDDWGVYYGKHENASVGTYPALGGHVIRSVESWREDVKVPDVDGMDFTKLRDGSGRLLHAGDIDRDEHLIEGFVELGIFERSYLLFGMEEALVNYLIEPEAMYELASLIADYKIRLIERLHEAFPLDMIWYGDDWGTQRDLFIPVDTWRAIIKPHTKRIYDCVKGLGMIMNQHSCGRIDSVFGDIVEMGADIWNPCQPCNPLGEMKKAYGDKIAFCGGIDSQFILDRQGVTPEEVRAEVRRRIGELAAGGGYIAAPSHSVPYDPVLLDAMNDEIAKSTLPMARGVSNGRS